MAEQKIMALKPDHKVLMAGLALERNGGPYNSQDILHKMVAVCSAGSAQDNAGLVHDAVDRQSVLRCSMDKIEFDSV